MEKLFSGTEKLSDLVHGYDSSDSSLQRKSWLASTSMLSALEGV